MLDSRRYCRYRGGGHRSIGVGLLKATFHDMPGPPLGSPPLPRPYLSGRGDARGATISARRSRLLRWRGLVLSTMVCRSLSPLARPQLATHLIVGEFYQIEGCRI